MMSAFLLVFYLLPENMEAVGELVEPELSWLMRSNWDILVKGYSARGVIIVNNHDDVHDSLFLKKPGLLNIIRKQVEKL